MLSVLDHHHREGNDTMASAKQIDYLATLHAELVELAPAEERDIWTLTAGKKLTLGLKPSSYVSNMIDTAKAELQRLRGLGRVAADRAWIEQVPAGRYGLVFADTTPGGDGTVTRWFRVGHGQAGSRHEGKLFLDETDGVNWDWNSRQPIYDKGERAHILAGLAADIVGAATRYGYRYNTCGVCRTALSDPLSVELGIGPVCWRKLRDAAREIQAAMTLAAACN